MNHSTFWNIRADRYDRLYWTKDESYIDSIVRASRFRRNDIVLDVGTGTGIMARAIKPHVRHVVGLDVSSSMLGRGRWEDFSVVKWDISDLLFANNIFDKVVARMVFHHILDNLDRVLLRCYDLLKEDGTLVVAEGIPPSDDKEVVDWYTHMFSFKEKRRTFTCRDLEGYLLRNGFVSVESRMHIMRDFSIRNWLVNSGVPREIQKKIMGMHLDASPVIKKHYNMRITRGDCLIEAKNVIVVGKKDIGLRPGRSG